MADLFSKPVPIDADMPASDDDTEHYFELGSAGFDNLDDQLLYHYTSAEVALDNVLPARTLRLNAYSVMRDPLENKELPLMLRYSTPGSPDRLPLRRAQEFVSGLRNQMRILSLTMDAAGYDDVRLRAFARGYARPRLWEHYAAKHEGVCLAFSANCLTTDFYERLKSYGVVTCNPVRYSDGGFVVSEGRLIDADGLTEDTAADVLTAHLMEHHEDFWFSKLSDWETEYEYRFVVFGPDLPIGEPLDVSFENCLRAIVLGEKFDPALEPEIAGYAADLGVVIGRLDWQGGRPSLVRLDS
jgi:hypothetical protein